MFARTLLITTGLSALFLTACSSSTPATTADNATPPPKIQAWMNRLTVAHAYDPKTGFIVARETVPLPAALTQRSIDAAIAQARADQLVIAFATADRCAPCQQFKHDALNDPVVLARLAEPRFVPTHVEVDQSPQLARKYLGTTSIPMTYALRDGKVIAELGGQRSAQQLLDALPK
jgi:thiol:disulfide interchange protein